jgi:hypothetical protein
MRPSWLSVVIGLILLGGGSLAFRIEGFQGGDDVLESFLDAPVVIGEALLAVAFGELEELGVVLGVLAVGGQELDGGLKLRAGQAGVGVGDIPVEAVVRNSRWGGWPGRGQGCA